MDINKALLILILIVCVFSCTQKNHSVKYSSTTSRNVKIEKIERNDSITRIDFKVDAVLWKTNGFKVLSKLTYIQNSKTGDKFDLIRANGIQLDSIYLDTIFENIRYSLIFPKIDNAIETIDFISENTEIFDIELMPQKHTTVIPKQLQGNWLRTDGSNEWVYGFYDNNIIYKDEFWKEFSLEEKGGFHVLTLKNAEETSQIFIKKSKQDYLLIGESSDHLKMFSRNKTINKEFKFKNDEELGTNIFKEGVAIYKGYIKGYHPKMNWEVKVYSPSVITNQYPEFVFNINDNGTFYAEIPLNYTKKMFIRIGTINESVFLEPEKTTIHYIDLNEHNAPFKNLTERASHERKSLFMGDLSRLNGEMKSLDSINYFDFNDIRDKILDMSAFEYKEYCLTISEKEQLAFKNYITKNPSLSKKARQLKAMEISFRTTSKILEYELSIRNAEQSAKSQAKKDLDFEKKDSIVMEEDLTSEYFDFLNWEAINNPASLITGAEYYFLINRLRYGSHLIKPGYYNYFEILIAKIMKRGITMSNDEKVMLNALLKCKTGEDFGKITRKKGSPWNSFNDKYNGIIVESRSENMNNIMNKKRKELYGIPDGFAKEIILGQEKIDYIKRNYKPFNKWNLEEIDTAITNKEIKSILLNHSKLKALEFSNNENSEDAIVHKIPKATNENLFYEIIKEYKGKAILIDFWATWCGPCLHSIEKAKPIKEKLKNKNIEFVYITGTTSPLKTYEAVIPGIKGHHYRLNKEQWAHLIKTFNIKGIPHYLFIDKEGNIVKEDMHSPFISGEFERLLKEYL